MDSIAYLCSWPLSRIPLIIRYIGCMELERSLSYLPLIFYFLNCLHFLQKDHSVHSLENSSNTPQNHNMWVLCCTWGVFSKRWKGDQATNFVLLLNLWTYFSSQNVLTEDNIYLRIYTPDPIIQVLGFLNTSMQFRRSARIWPWILLFYIS